MKNLLVPCDFSAPSREAYKFAADLAQKIRGRIIVLNAAFVPVLQDPGYAGGTPLAYDPSFLARVEDDVKEWFEEMKNEVSSGTVPVTLKIIHDGVTSAIQKAVEGDHIDLIIMGTSGASGLSEIFIGSNTEKVVRFSTVPVLTVRKAPETGSIHRILLPSTLELDQTDFMNHVKELQELFDATLHVLLINTPANFYQDDEAQEALEEFARHYQLKNHFLHFRNYYNEEDGIIDFAARKKIDVVAMGTHSRKGLSHLFNGSITEDVVNHITYPVWTYTVKKTEKASKKREGKLDVSFEM